MNLNEYQTILSFLSRLRPSKLYARLNTVNKSHYEENYFAVILGNYACAAMLHIYYIWWRNQDAAFGSRHRSLQQIFQFVRNIFLISCRLHLRIRAGT